MNFLTLFLPTGYRRPSHQKVQHKRPSSSLCVCVCVRLSYPAGGLLREGLVVVQDLIQTGVQQLLQGGPGQSMPPHPVHLHTQLE